MTSKNVTFKIKDIITGTNGPAAVKIDGKITVKGEEIKKIIFVGKEKDKIENKIKDGKGKSFKLTYDDSKVKIEKGGGNFTTNSASAEPKNTASASHTASASAAFEMKKEPSDEIIVENDKTLRVIYMNENGSIKLEESTASGNNEDNKDDDNKDDDNKDDDNKDDDNKDDDNKDDDNKDDDNKDDDNNSPKNPSATPEETTAKNELDTAEASGDKEKIKQTLEKHGKLVQNSSNASLAKSYEKAEEKLNEVGDKKDVREILQNQVKNLLEKAEVKSDDLGSAAKTKYDELNNNNNNNNAVQDKASRDEIVKAVLNKLISELETALNKGDKKKIESGSQKLEDFGKSKLTYQKRLYNDHKSKIRELLNKAKDQKSTQNKGFFRLNNPAMWISGAALIAVIVGVIWLVSSRSKKAEIE